MKYFKPLQNAEPVKGRTFKKDIVVDVVKILSEHFGEDNIFLVATKQKYTFDIRNNGNVIGSVTIDFDYFPHPTIKFGMPSAYLFEQINHIMYTEVANYKDLIKDACEKITKHYNDELSIENDAVIIRDECKNGIYHDNKVNAVVNYLNAQNIKHTVEVRFTKLALNDVQYTYGISCTDPNCFVQYFAFDDKGCQIAFKRKCYSDNNIVNVNDSDKFVEDFEKTMNKRQQNQNKASKQIESIKDLYGMTDSKNIASKVYAFFVEYCSKWGGDYDDEQSLSKPVLSAAEFIESARERGTVTDTEISAFYMKIDMSMSDNDIKDKLYREVPHVMMKNFYGGPRGRMGCGMFGCGPFGYGM